MSTPALSFVIPAYNASATVGETLRSVIAQTRDDWSAVVVDDGSTDGTGGVCEGFADPRVRVVRQENRGLAGARNRGFAECNGGAVCFLDADDLLSSRFAEMMLKGIGGADLCACGYAMVGSGLEDLGWEVRPSGHDATLARMAEFNPFAVGSVVVRRSSATRLAERTELFDTSLPVHEDWDLWLRMTAAGARWAPIVDEALFRYRVRPGSMSGDLKTMWREGVRVIAGAPVEPALREGITRRWAVRSAARAAARGDAALTGALLQEAGGLDAETLDVFVGALWRGLCWEDRVGPERADEARVSAWQERVAGALAGMAGVESVLSRMMAGRWAKAAARVRERAGSGDTVVIYGVGRNGRALLGAMGDARGLALAWMDDHPSAEPPRVRGRELRRLSVEELSPRHVVVVTPERREEILRRLRERGVERVEIA